MKEILTNKMFEKIYRLTITFYICLFIIALYGCYKAPLEQPYIITQQNNLILAANKAYQKGHIQQAFALYQAALKQSRIIQDDNAKVIILISLSRLYSSINQIGDAKKMIDLAVDISKKEHLPLETVEELNFERCKLGFILNENTEEALFNLSKSNNAAIRIKSLNLLARIKMKNNEIEKAEELLRKSLSANHEVSKIEEANSFRLLGEVYTKKGSQMAEMYFLKALAIDKAQALPLKIALDYQMLAKFYESTKNTEKVKECYQKAIEIYNELGESALVSQIENKMQALH